MKCKLQNIKNEDICKDVQSGSCMGPVGDTIDLDVIKRHSCICW